MRKGIIGLALLLTISLIPANSATPPKAGAVCSKRGVTKTYQGKKYTCIKSGKKLVWNKGVVIKKPSPTPIAPTPEPSVGPVLPPQPQTISFNLPTSLKREQTGLQLEATASSGLKVEFKSESPTVCEVKENKLFSLHAGTCLIRADQSGSSLFIPSSTVAKTTILANIVLINPGGAREKLKSVFPTSFQEKNPILSTTPELTVLPSGAVGIFYSYEFTATGGSHPPYYFQISRGMIPPGLNFDNLTGKLSGIPTRSGKYSLTLGAMDTDYTSPNAATEYGIGKYVNYAYGNFELTISGVDNLDSPYFTLDWSKSSGVIPYPMDYYLEKYGGRSDIVEIDKVPALALTAVADKFFLSGTWSSQTNQASMGYAGVAKHFFSDRAKWNDDENFDNWTRAKIFFPADYTPSGLFDGTWNWLLGWHSDDYSQTLGGNSILLGVFASNPDSQGRGYSPRLALRLMGGDINNKIIDHMTCSQASGELELQHWYDVIIHMVWSADPKVGKAEMWLDGKKICSTSFPTLYRHVDGSSSWINGFGLYNYRPMQSWSSTIYFGNFSIGPTARSIGFSAP